VPNMNFRLGYAAVGGGGSCEDTVRRKVDRFVVHNTRQVE
jgi:hypothetical protein